MKIPAKKLLVSLMLALPLIASAKVCETWNVDGDDEKGNITGAWNFNYGSNPGQMTGNGHMKSGSGEISYFDVSAKVAHFNAYIKTENASNKISCTFLGRYVGNDQVVGTYSCTPDIGKFYNWSAKVSVCKL